MQAPGWQAFDASVVAAIKRREPHAVDTTHGGGMKCPLHGHEHWLPWVDGDVRKGTEPHGPAELQLRASPTYVLKDPLLNFSFGRALIAEALDGAWGKAETGRLGFENSEDAASWNVFRAMQEAGFLHLAVRALVGIQVPEHAISLVLWGRQIGAASSIADQELKAALDHVEADYTQQTEPDVVLRVGGWGWIFIEAKLSSPTSTYAGRHHRLAGWAKQYATPEGPFDPSALQQAIATASKSADGFPEQLLRNVAVADRVRSGANALVVALVRDRDREKVDGWAAGWLRPDAAIRTGTATWEQLYTATAEAGEGATALRQYMYDKSVGLRPAFDLGQLKTPPASGSQA